MRIPSRDELLGTSIADQSTRMQAMAIATRHDV